MSKVVNLIDRIANTQRISKAKAKENLEAVFNSISEELGDNNTVKIQGFGSFNKSPLKRSSILFGKKYEIDTNVVRFSAFKQLKESVNY
jgi:nucleoid DNA-binding protein